MDGGEVAHDEGEILALETQAVVGSLWKLSRRAALDLFEKPSVWEVSCIVKKNEESLLLAGKFVVESQITGRECPLACSQNVPLEKSLVWGVRRRVATHAEDDE